ncbi:MAG: hypothetical protein E7157_05460 [Lactobacillales bacterium]|nr:hypothetical protein [Lactobacillales bacterium]
MKILDYSTGKEKIYVQKNDIMYLNQTDLSIPASIFMKIFGNGVTIIDNSNRFEFVEFTNSHEIEFLKNIDWIIDYNEVKELSKDEIMKLANEIANKQNEIADKYNNMSPEDKQNNKDIIFQHETLDYKFYSLRDFLWFKQGHLKMELSEGIEYPSDFKPKGLIKRIFRKKQK